MNEIEKWIEENQPHRVMETICLKCLDRCMTVYPDKLSLKDLVCDVCEEKGFIIGTGQPLYDDEVP